MLIGKIMEAKRILWLDTSRLQSFMWLLILLKNNHEIPTVSSSQPLGSLFREGLVMESFHYRYIEEVFGEDAKLLRDGHGNSHPLAQLYAENNSSVAKRVDSALKRIQHKYPQWLEKKAKV